MRRPAAQGKKDANQMEIIRALERVGAKVIELNAVGGGVPDLLVGRAGKFYLLEVKVDRKQVLTPMQLSFFLRFAGYPCFRVNSAVEALEAVGVEIAKEPI